MRRGQSISRKKQFEILEKLFTWDVSEVGHFTIAFYAHYQLLDAMLENCAERFRNIGIPRFDYFLYREYIYIIYSELCITIETLLKSLLEENGYTESQIKEKSHDLNKLINELENIDTTKTNKIREILRSHQDEINYLVKYNIFINARYMIDAEEVSLMHINKISSLISDIDLIYKMYYLNFNWLTLLYPDSM